MIQSFESAESPTEFTADVCIVGSGAAGVSLALSLAAKSTIRVIVVESGSRNPEDRFQKLSAGETVNERFRGLSEGRARALGGATRLWYGQCVRLQPIDYQERAWVPHSGWPITAADLEPWYDEADRFFQVKTKDLGDTIYGKFALEAPGWSPAAIKTNCTVYSPVVDFDRVFSGSLRTSPNIQVLLDATVVHVNTNEAGTKADGVEIRSLNGRVGHVHARVTVLCGGGIENARLLLASNRLVAEGLGNSKDLVGRFFQDHPNGFTATIDAANPQDLQRRFSILYEKQLRYFPKFSLAEDLQQSRRILNTTSHLFFEYESDTGIESMKAFGRALRRRTLPANAAHHAFRIFTDLGSVASGLSAMLQKGISPGGKIRRILLQTFLEQAPNPLNRVCLSTQTDPFGVPQARIEWTMAEIERQTAVEAVRAFSAEFDRLKFGRVRAEESLQSDQWQATFADAFHHSGTTRMASDPSRGVVNTDSKVFGIDGLYVAGSSVFPTSGWANPTLTIVALALRLSAHLAQLL